MATRVRTRRAGDVRTTIEHVVVLMLENRSFDHLLAYSGIQGLKGVNPRKSNPGPHGPVAMGSTAPDQAPNDPGHEFEDVDGQIFSVPYTAKPRPTTLDGFVKAGGAPTMACASPARVPVFTHLAQRFLVCDQWFSSMPGPTWPNRFFVHAGSSGGLSNSPSNLTTIGSMLWSKLGFSFEHGTLFDRLTRAKKTWRVYHGDHFPQVCAINTMPSVFVASRTQFRRQRDFAGDVARGDVANYTFIEPNYSILSSFRNGDSQHPPGALSAGEALIADVVNAIIASPVWSSSLLLILYDEHGGYYDQMPPPSAVPPGDAPRNVRKAQNAPTPPFAFDRYGIRTPAVVVSPWVRSGSVSHTLYDHASVVRTVFDVFSLPGSLTQRDGRAASLKGEFLSVPSARTPDPIPSPPHTSGADAIQAQKHENDLRNSGSLNGFTRIAAQIHHALEKYRVHLATGSRPETLVREFHATDDLSYLPGLPQTPDPNEARTYIERVANELDAHRARQRSLQNP